MDYRDKITFDEGDVVRREQYLRNHFVGLLSEETISSLIENNFLTAPASTKYHGSYVGGLFDHSINVAHVLYELSRQNNLSWVRSSSPEDSPHVSAMIVGLLHDLCKTDQYIKKNEEWVYTNGLITGHGVKSVVYAQRWGVQLTDEEIACITYHMGAFEDDKRAYTEAVHKYPNVLWTHTADMIVSQIMEV